MTPRVSVIIPTRWRDTLRRTLRSIRSQAGPGDVEIVLVEDAHGQELPAVRAAAEEFGCVYAAHDAGHHCFGHCQINRGMRLATGQWLSFMDDDDIYEAGAFAAIAAEAQQLPEPLPMMFQLLSYQHVVLWREPVVKQGRVGGHCLVVPNMPERLGQWACRYEGDYDFIESTLALWPDVKWVPTLIAVARPDEDFEDL